MDLNHFALEIGVPVVSSTMMMCAQEPDDAANRSSEAFEVHRKTDPRNVVRVLAGAIRH